MPPVNQEHIRIAKVVGENEEGITLFVPKDMQGVFHLEEGDSFLTMMFLRDTGEGSVESWLPWEGAQT